VVLFGAVDSKDNHYQKACMHLQDISEPETYLGTFALLEFDIVMKSRGFSFESRMENHALLLRDYPHLDSKVAAISSATFYLSSKLEDETDLEYFDAGIAAEALQLDGKVVSTDRAFDKVDGLKRIW
jgi:predicted nucleic acid-binding protein